MTPVASLALAACLAVNPHSDQITAGDFAAAVPALAAAAPETPVALAPAPGLRRVFHGPEIERIAAKVQITVAFPGEVCFERRVRPLEESAIQAAMQRSAPVARINLLDYSHAPAPDGQLEFPISGLRQTPSGGWWNGFVTYGRNHRFVVWAKVKVAVTAARVVANQALTPGQPVTLEQVHMETREVSPSPGKWPGSVEEVVGRLPSRRIPAGAALDSEWLEAPKDVSRGDRLRIDVWSGAAHLKIEGMAEGSGVVGQTIPVLNLDSKKRFRARVEGPGRASVRSDVR